LKVAGETLDLLMAINDHVLAAAVHPNDCLHDDVDCDELVATVYGTHIRAYQ